MTDYRFDDLGWYQFERLAQGILKAELGPSVQSWGGRGDWGRDAWCNDPLPFPTKDEPKDGPFLFQVKFVENANAAGAKPSAAVKASVSAEIAKLNIKSVENPRHYVFITNALLTPDLRGWISDKFSEIHPNCSIHSWGGKDLSDILHRHPFLRRAYPEILSLRDLNHLIEEVINRDIHNRSRDALEFARDLVPAFVPTETYQKSFDTLRKHHFVVLDGPPEMGKTTIARMIGLVLFSETWEIVECVNPHDLDRAYDSQRLQLFIADDAFGRTEYDPTKGRAWEEAIPRLLHRLDGKHWLAWTTRKHILQRALEKMDLQTPAHNFPKPAEVVVTASELTIEEKARILYRHARAAGLSTERRAIIRSHAETIVSSEHFTPERIRRLCGDEIESIWHPNLDEGALEQVIDKAIENPTASMRKAYKNLPESYRWLLVAMLDKDASEISELRPIYERRAGDISDQEFQRRIDDIDGTFVHIRRLQILGRQRTLLDWVHPSFRDLVIDELSADLTIQKRYWETASPSAVQLALSEAGGATGSRHWPLLQHERSWQWFCKYCDQLAKEGTERTVSQLLQDITDAFQQEEPTDQQRAHLRDAVIRISDVLATRWETDLPNPNIETIWRFSQLLQAGNLKANMPDIKQAYLAQSSSIQHIEDWGWIEDPNNLDQWLSSVSLVDRHLPEWKNSTEFSELIETDIDRISATLDNDLDSFNSDDDIDNLTSESERFRSIAQILRKMSNEFADDAYGLGQLAFHHCDACNHKADRLEEEAMENSPDEEYFPEERVRDDTPFDITEFFSDL